MTLGEGLGAKGGSLAPTVLGLSLVFPFSLIDDSKEYWQTKPKTKGASE